MGVSQCRRDDDQTSRKPIRSVNCNLVNDLEEEHDSGVYATNDEALIASTNPVTPSPHKNTSSSTAFFVVGGSSDFTRELLVENKLKGVERVKSSSHGFQRADSLNGINVAISPSSSYDGQRVGYDGTRRTPSNQLLKPTASSTAQRVNKIVHSTALLSTPSATHRYQLAKFQSSSRHRPYTPPSRHWTTKAMNDSNEMLNNQQNQTPTKEVDDSMKKMTIGLPFRIPSTPPPSSINPFQHLNESYGSISKNSTMDDDEMEEINKTPKERDDRVCERTLLKIGDDLNGSSPDSGPSLESGEKLSTPTPNILAGTRHRSFSWSPGSKVMRDAYDEFHGCSQRIRSSMYDPVASHLLTCCVEESEGQISPSFSFEEVDGCPLDFNNQEVNWHAPFGPSVSMPNLHAPLSPILAAQSLDEINDNITIKEDPSQLLSSGIPASPSPLFRKVSGSLHDVKTDEDLSCLARPIPRKCSAALKITPRD
mmetsp:Transcript_9189/g.19613  ORF Transcript_9189/g.19613 Transcript_9189/m.19613 type:complete len:481 (+) Transcript_9189:485-1927(+)